MKQDLKNMKKCKGCKAVLQTTDSNKIGYVKDLNYDYCLSCFNLKHYNKADDIVLQTHFPIITGQALVVYIVSALHLNTLLKYDLKKFYPHQKLIILINKIDLLPKTINFDYWINNIKKQTKHLNVLEVMPISALKGHYLSLFLETLFHYKMKDVYFIGMQNSGKSTLLNKIAEKEEIKEVALTAHQPGLTKDNIVYTYKGLNIIDTPGIYEKGFISDFLSYEQYKTIIPKKRFRPVTYQLNSNQSVIIGGLVIISLLKGNKTSFTFYLGNINTHRTKYENAYNLFEKHKGDLFTPVTNNEYEKRNIRISKEKKHIINIMDLGYLVVSGEVTLELYYPKGANILINEESYHGL